ncbi:MAG: sugar-binding transcriptional regulator [Balneolales bacterium]
MWQIKLHYHNPYTDTYMPRPNDPVDLRLISKVSSLYYYQNLNQQAIAKRLQLSRLKISRLLKQARDQGIVQISIAFPDDNFIGLETKLEEKYHLKEVVIVESSISENSISESLIQRQLGLAAANFLHRSISEGDVIGLTWGTTLQAMIDSVQPKPTKDLHVIQTLGGVGPPEAKAHATDISRRLSNLLGSKLNLLPAPGIVESVEAKNVLLSDRRVRSTLDLFSKINTLYVGLGALNTNPVLIKDNHEISSQLQQEILKSDAVGDIGLNFFNANGDEVNTKFKDLIIGISMEELKKVDTVVGIAGGAQKLHSIAGALKGKLIDVLIVDNHTAQKLLAS